MKDEYRSAEGVSLPRGTKSYLHASNKKARRNFDADKLDYIQTNLGLPCIREKEIFDARYTQAQHKRTPDLLINGRVILEHDTYNIHGELNDPNERTLKRNIDHCLGNYPWFTIHEDLIKILCKQYYHLMEENLTVSQLASFCQVFLSHYLYYHTLGQDLARRKARELTQY